MSDNAKSEIESWWSTSIIRMEPNQIDICGTPIEALIGDCTFPEMIWLMLRGSRPSQAQAKLLEAALVAAVDHGPQAPSIAAARMAASCGVGLNNALATGVNMLGDVHGGAGQQAVELFHYIAASNNVEDGVKQWQDRHGKYLPGFGHRFHQIDPRAPRLMELVREAKASNVVDGRFEEVACAIEGHISRRDKPVPMNIDGATAVIYAELGFAPELARGLFCLSRSVGILAHAWEEKQSGSRNKGPMPKGYLWRTTDPSEA